MKNSKVFLLDTHALLWWWTNDPQLPKRIRALIADPANTIVVSAVCAWEMAIKHRLGKLGTAGQAVQEFGALIIADQFTHLPISWAHSLRAGALVAEHRDPFDRMLAAQSDCERVPLISADAALVSIPQLPVIWD